MYMFHVMFVKGLKVTDKKVEEDSHEKEPEFEVVEKDLTENVELIKDDEVSEKVIEEETKISLNEEVKKEATEKTKDVVKETKKEEKIVEQKTEPKVVKELKKVIPKIYELNDDELTYQVLGQDEVKMNLKNIKAITKTINSEGSLVKVVVNDENVSCVLTSMRGIDLNNIMEELHEKMLKYDANFEEKVEYKEY